MIAILKLIASLVVIAMLGSSLVSYQILRRADATGVLVLQSHRALEATEETLRRAIDAESGVRAYLISRDRVFLAPFERADQTIRRALDDLQQSVGGDSERQNVRQLRGEVEQLFVALRALLVRASGEAAPHLEIRDDAKAHVETIRQLAREIRRGENERLVARMAADDEAGRSVYWVALIAAAAAAALATGTGAVALVLIRPGWGWGGRDA